MKKLTKKMLVDAVTNYKIDVLLNYFYSINYWRHGNASMQTDEFALISSEIIKETTIHKSDDNVHHNYKISINDFNITATMLESKCDYCKRTGGNK